MFGVWEPGADSHLRCPCRFKEYKEGCGLRGAAVCPAKDPALRPLGSSPLARPIVRKVARLAALRSLLLPISRQGGARIPGGYRFPLFAGPAPSALVRGRRLRGVPRLPSAEVHHRSPVAVLVCSGPTRDTEQGRR